MLPEWIFKGNLTSYILILLATALFCRKYNLSHLNSTTMWAINCLLFTFMMTSGTMWNHIRDAPVAQMTPRGELILIYPSSHGQFLLETYMIIVIYAAAVAGMVILIEAASLKKDASMKRNLSLFGVVLLVVFFSLLLSIFGKKSRYPFRLLFR